MRHCIHRNVCPSTPTFSKLCPGAGLAACEAAIKRELFLSEYLHLSTGVNNTYLTGSWGIKRFMVCVKLQPLGWFNQEIFLFFIAYRLFERQEKRKRERKSIHWLTSQMPPLSRFHQPSNPWAITCSLPERTAAGSQE